MTTLERFLLESKALKLLTPSLVREPALPAAFRKAIRARSVLLPPMMLPPLTETLVLTPAPMTTSAARESGIWSRDWNTCPLPVASSTTDSLPSVMVPVLSLKRMLRLPAVSRPLIFRTSTLSLAIFRLWKDSRMLVSMGSPSGTAQTMMVTATVTASMIRRIHS